jgi:putative transposase
LLKNNAIHPETITTDGLASYRAAMRDLGLTKRHRTGGVRANNRAEKSHLSIRRRERKQQKFKSQGAAQRLLFIHTAVYKKFNVQQHLLSLPTLRHFLAVAH